MTEEQWGVLQDQICKAIGQNNHKTWIVPLRFAGSTPEGTVTLQAPTNFFSTYVTQN
ncbi:MAG: chromosomal replication initiator protein DnaA, partial [Mameliella sp.]|nr:chromosomal replication initiator protein DnaA [Mameliella sp.]